MRRFSPSTMERTPSPLTARRCLRSRWSRTSRACATNSSDRRNGPATGSSDSPSANHLVEPERHRPAAVAAVAERRIEHVAVGCPSPVLDHHSIG